MNLNNVTFPAKFKTVDGDEVEILGPVTHRRTSTVVFAGVVHAPRGTYTHIWDATGARLYEFGNVMSASRRHLVEPEPPFPLVLKYHTAEYLSVIEHIVATYKELSNGPSRSKNIIGRLVGAATPEDVDEIYKYYVNKLEKKS